MFQNIAATGKVVLSFWYSARPFTGATNDLGVIFGGFTGIHQFCRIGAHVITAASSLVLQDVPPYLMVAGNTAQPYGIHVEGLKRRGFTSEAITELKRAYRTLYKSGLLLEEAKGKLAEQARTQPDVQRLVDFLEVSKRGVIR